MITIEELAALPRWRSSPAGEQRAGHLRLRRCPLRAGEARRRRGRRKGAWSSRSSAKSCTPPT